MEHLRHKKMKWVDLEAYLERRQESRRDTLAHGGCAYDVDLLRGRLRAEIRMRARVAELMRRWRRDLAATGQTAARKRVEAVLILLTAEDGLPAESSPSGPKGQVYPEPVGPIPPEPTDEEYEMAHAPEPPVRIGGGGKGMTAAEHQMDVYGRRKQE